MVRELAIEHWNEERCRIINTITDVSVLTMSIPNSNIGDYSQNTTRFAEESTSFHAAESPCSHNAYKGQSQ